MGKGINKVKAQTTKRKFGGGLMPDDFIVESNGLKILSTEYRRQEKKHLKAYLKGWESFKYGTKETESGITIPNFHPVMELWVNKE